MTFSWRDELDVAVPVRVVVPAHEGRYAPIPSPPSGFQRVWMDRLAFRPPTVAEVV